MINYVTIIVVLLYIWFDTDAFIEWAKFLKLSCFKYKEYQNLKKTDFGQTMITNYVDFLTFSYSKWFFIKIISCSLCLSTWMGIIAVLMTRQYQEVGNIILTSWIGYYGLRWVIKKTNE